MYINISNWQDNEWSINLNEWASAILDSIIRSLKKTNYGDRYAYWRSDWSAYLTRGGYSTTKRCKYYNEGEKGLSWESIAQDPDTGIRTWNCLALPNRFIKIMSDDLTISIYFNIIRMEEDPREWQNWSFWKITDWLKMPDFSSEILYSALIMAISLLGVQHLRWLGIKRINFLFFRNLFSAVRVDFQSFQQEYS